MASEPSIYLRRSLESERQLALARADYEDAKQRLDRALVALILAMRTAAHADAQAMAAAEVSDGE